MRLGGELMAASPEVQGLRGRHVLFAFLGFFGVIFAVNGVFLYAALSTHTGVVANEPYRKGLNYNQRIAAFQAQEQLGWAEDDARSGCRTDADVAQVRWHAGFRSVRCWYFRSAVN